MNPILREIMAKSRQVLADTAKATMTQAFEAVRSNDSSQIDIDKLKKLLEMEYEEAERLRFIITTFRKPEIDTLDKFEKFYSGMKKNRRDEENYISIDAFIAEMEPFFHAFFEEVDGIFNWIQLNFGLSASDRDTMRMKYYQAERRVKAQMAKGGYGQTE